MYYIKNNTDNTGIYSNPPFIVLNFTHTQHYPLGTHMTNPKEHNLDHRPT